VKTFSGKVELSKKHRFSDERFTPRYDAAKRIRSSDRWKQVRELAMAKAAGMCLYCHKAAAEEVHHIKSVAEHPELAFDMDNLIPLCIRCHGWMGTREKRGEDTETQLKEKRLMNGGW
jgi:5-methylcytosine-specific restriction endonuclease McrA